MSIQFVGSSSGLTDLVVALATVVVVPLLVLSAGKLFDAVMRAWDPNTDPEERLDWSDE